MVEQVTKFPREQGTTLKIKTSRPARRAIHVRIPSWIAQEAQVKINGKLLEASADPGSYLSIRRTWQDGDTVNIALPMKLRQESLHGDDSVVAALYGPLVLAADLGAGPSDGPLRVVRGRDTAPKDLPAAAALPKVAAGEGASTAQFVQVQSPSELRFTVAGEAATYDLVPMYQIRDQRYSIYMQTTHPKQQI